MNPWVVAGLIAGGAAGWFAASSRAKGVVTELRAQTEAFRKTVDDKDQQAAQLHQQVKAESEQRIAAQTELSQARLRIDEEKKLLEEIQRNLVTAFDALAGKALKSNNQAFLELAKSTFATIQAQAKGDLETRQKAIDGLISPLKDSLARYEKQIQDLENRRQAAYGSLGKQLSDLQGLTQDLNTALRGSHTKVRGRWGELTLHRVAELAGMTEHCDFSEQESVTTEAGRQRPDMVIHLAGGRRIPVDSKVPLQAFLEAVSANRDEERAACLKRHCDLVRTHMERLAKQSYPELFGATPDIVVMFLPGEPFLAAALERDATLLEDAMRKRVMLATPTVLIALLLAIQHGWQQQELAQTAAKVQKLGKDLYERIQTAAGHFQGIGHALGKAVDSYNNTVRSLESRFFPAARKFKDMVVPTAADIGAPEPVETEPRALQSHEWKNGEDDFDRAEDVRESAPGVQEEAIRLHDLSGSEVRR